MIEATPDILDAIPVEHNAPEPTLKQKLTPSDRGDGQSITIGLERNEIFAFCRDFGNFAKFMKGVCRVDVNADLDSHWVVDLKGGVTFEWDVMVVDEVINEWIAWESTESSAVRATGKLRLADAPGNRGTVVSLAMSYAVPGGKVSEFLGATMGEDPDTLVQLNLKRLKAYLETGEVPTIDGQPSGREELATERCA